MTRRCAVAIFFHEPTFELYSQKKVTPRVAVFNVFAPSTGEAKRRAIAEFRDGEALSSVGWARAIVHVAIFVVEPRGGTTRA